MSQSLSLPRQWRGDPLTGSEGALAKEEDVPHVESLRLDQLHSIKRVVPQEDFPR